MAAADKRGSSSTGLLPLHVVRSMSGGERVVTFATQAGTVAGDQ